MDDQVADVVKGHQIGGLRFGPGQGIGVDGRVTLGELGAGEGLKEGDTAIVVKLKLRGAGDVAADHRFPVDVLVILQLGALRAEDAKTVAPAQRKLHEGEIPPLSADVSIYFRHPGAGQGHGQGELVEEGEHDEQAGGGN